MIITIGGLAGTGTTTTAELLSKKLDIPYISAGFVFREMAAERGMSVLEFSEFAEGNDDIDKEIDKRQALKAKEADNLIIEGRLSAFFVDNADLKNLVKKNGGIVIRDNDNMSNVLSYQGLNPAFNIGKINKQAEIKSMRTIPAKLSKINQLNLIQRANDNLRLSSKINVSFHDNVPANDALINIPKEDEPLPDIDELSTESPILILRSSIETE